MTPIILGRFVITIGSQCFCYPYFINDEHQIVSLLKITQIAWISSWGSQSKFVCLTTTLGNPSDTWKMKGVETRKETKDQETIQRENSKEERS